MTKSSKKRARVSSAKGAARGATRAAKAKKSDRPVSRVPAVARVGRAKSRGNRAKSKDLKAPEGGKIAAMTVMLCRLKGVSINELCKATGWQAHSVRAAISATIKKKLKLEVASEKIDGVRFYRVIV